MQYKVDDTMMVVRKNDFFSKLLPQDFESLNILHNYLVADKNSYLYLDAKHHNKLYFIKEGCIKIGMVDKNGEEIIKDILYPGDIFGQVTLSNLPLQDEFARAYKKEVTLCAFSVTDFENLLHNKPALAIQFSKKVGEKLHKVDVRLSNFLQRDVRSRLLHFFWTILEQKNMLDNTSATIDNFLTHKDIAQLTGTIRQTITTLINQFTKEGILEMNRRQIIIHDVVLLKELAAVS
ncbi:MAG TPA: Crp/Fnr family transcriptional regulator [Ferruginibacter sp.]|jgi:CRP/FNR family cyclic AMP-dependent transcriptional regulator|nr:Crp/Fnr family transcriptional regulator [Ferruginibacter sp.]